jgi:hypothetical protein
MYLTKHHVMKTYWGSRVIAPHILNVVGKMELSDQLHSPDALV